MAHVRISFLVAALLAACGSDRPPAVQTRAETQAPPPEPPPECVWCGAREAPASIGPRVQLAEPGEPGEPMVLTGRVVRADGSPAAGLVVYAYHTNAEGVYAKRGDETGNGVRHGHLRGWLRTDANGRFELISIRPAAYPTSDAPAHIHVTVLDGDLEYWVDDVNFADDPLLPADHRAAAVDLRRDDGGTWRGDHVIRLPATPPPTAVGP